MKRVTWLAAVAGVGLIPLGFTLAQHDYGHHHMSPPAEPSKGVDAKKPAASMPAQIVEVAVTEDGFVPAEVRVKAGQPVRLRVTRKTEQTCAKDIVIKSLGVNKPLPLDTTVEIVLTPARGKLRYACAMDMIAGTIIAE